MRSLEEITQFVQNYIFYFSNWGEEIAILSRLHEVFKKEDKFIHINSLINGVVNKDLSKIISQKQHKRFDQYLNWIRLHSKFLYIFGTNPSKISLKRSGSSLSFGSLDDIINKISEIKRLEYFKDQFNRLTNYEKGWYIYSITNNSNLFINNYYSDLDYNNIKIIEGFLKTNYVKRLIWDLSIEGNPGREEISINTYHDQIDLIIEKDPKFIKYLEGHCLLIPISKSGNLNDQLKSDLIYSKMLTLEKDIPKQLNDVTPKQAHTFFCMNEYMDKLLEIAELKFVSFSERYEDLESFAKIVNCIKLGLIFEGQKISKEREDKMNRKNKIIHDEYISSLLSNDIQTIFYLLFPFFESNSKTSILRIDISRTTISQNN